MRTSELTFEEHLLSRAIDVQAMASMSFKDNVIKKFKEYWLFLFSVVLIGLGWGVHDIGILGGLGEAMMIAGILALGVDPFLKRRLLKEAAAGIFEHLIGFDQEPEIKKKIRDTAFETALFRKDLRVSIDIKSKDGEAQLDISFDYELVNQSNKTHPYTHKADFEEAEKPIVHEMTILSDDISYKKCPPDLNVRSKDNEAGVIEAQFDEISIKPRSKGVRYHFSTRCSVSLPKNFYFPIHFSVPTIGVTLKLTKPEDCEVFPTPSKIQTGSEWRYDRLFMPGESINVRWKFREESSKP